MIATSIKNRIASGKAWVDVLAIVALLLLHPVLYRLDMMLGIYSPDATAYMEFAQHYLSNGLLYLERGLTGQGVVLPPLYPLFILVASFFVGDFVIASVLVTSFATISASIVFYFIIRKFGNPYFAFLGAFCIQLNYKLNVWALSPVTEAVFILIVACFLWFMLRVVNRESIKTYVVLGILLTLVFFTRQIGLVLAPFALLIIMLSGSRGFVTKSAGVMVGMVLLLVPYVFAVHQQGTEIDADISAFAQTWSKRDLILIDDVDQEIQDYLRDLSDTSGDTYTDVFMKRRLLRQLLPDSSAMLSEVRMEPPDRATNALTEKLLDIWSSLDRFGGNLANNIRFLVDTLGLLVCGVFLVTLLTPFWFGLSRQELLQRYVIGGFVVYFLLATSLLTGLVGRYVEILAPFILLHIGIETTCLLAALRRSIRGISVNLLLYSGVMATCAYTQPQNYSDVGGVSQENLEQFSGNKFRQFVEPGAPTMSIIPFHAFTAGGAWRIIPNDSLERTAIFAEREGIRWLFVVYDSAVIERTNAQHLTAEWYLDPELQTKYEELIQLRAMSNDGRFFLFQFN